MGDDRPKADRRLQATCGLWFLGEFVAVFVGVALLAAALQLNAPFWLAAVALFGPAALVNLLAAVLVLPRLVREFREFRRNAPSPESVAAAAGASVPAEVDLFHAPSDKPDEPSDSLPGVPDVATTPGRFLSHRLESADLAPGCQFGCSVFAAVFWNGILSIFVWRLLADWNKMGGFRWLYAAFLSPFALVGAFLILAVVATALRWFVSSLTGRVEVELSTHPLVPGGTSRIHVSQYGSIPLGRIKLELICTEAVTYTAGTSTSTATKDVVQHVIAHPDDNPHGSLPLEVDFTVPAEAMHSFESPNNKIRWTIRVTGRVFGLRLRHGYRLAMVPGESP